jgi:hypothetical protein
MTVTVYCATAAVGLAVKVIVEEKVGLPDGGFNVACTSVGTPANDNVTEYDCGVLLDTVTVVMLELPWTTPTCCDVWMLNPVLCTVNCIVLLVAKYWFPGAYASTYTLHWPA